MFKVTTSVLAADSYKLFQVCRARGRRRPGVGFKQQDAEELTHILMMEMISKDLVANSENKDSNIIFGYSKEKWRPLLVPGRI